MDDGVFDKLLQVVGEALHVVVSNLEKLGPEKIGPVPVGRGHFFERFFCKP